MSAWTGLRKNILISINLLAIVSNAKEDSTLKYFNMVDFFSQSTVNVQLFFNVKYVIINYNLY